MSASDQGIPITDEGRWAGDCIEDPARLRRTLNGETGTTEAWVTAVSTTRSPRKVFCSPEIRSLLRVPREPHNMAHQLEVVASDIFATSNPLKSHEPRKSFSPFSNIRAVTSKLCARIRGQRLWKIVPR
jgi:hypothetical protein